MLFWTRPPLQFHFYHANLILGSRDVRRGEEAVNELNTINLRRQGLYSASYRKICTRYFFRWTSLWGNQSFPIETWFYCRIFIWYCQQRGGTFTIHFLFVFGGSCTNCWPCFVCLAISNRLDLDTKSKRTSTWITLDHIMSTMRSVHSCNVLVSVEIARIPSKFLYKMAILAIHMVLIRRFWMLILWYMPRLKKILWLMPLHQAL